MDEVFFRSSQKLESLQMQLGLAAEEGKNILRHYSEQSKALFTAAWSDNSRLEHLRENIKDLWSLCILLINEVKDNAVQFPKTVYESFIKSIGKQWTRQNVCFGCVGFFIGAAVGVGIGMAMRRNQPVSTYVQAIQCSQYLGTEYVSMVEDAIAPQHCEGNEVLVNVKAASVQIVDVQICNGYGRMLRRLLSRYFKHSAKDLPVTLGRDCSGIIVDVGQGVSRLDIGDEVWLTVPFWAPGTLCQTIVVRENKVSRKPKHIGFEAAASIPYAGCIVLASLEEADLTEENAQSKRVLVHCGCTPVGCVLIQILSSWGSHVTTTCFSRAVPVAKALGADEVIVIPEMQTAKNKVDLEIPINSTSNTLAKELELTEDFDVIFYTKDCRLTEDDLKKYCKESGVVISTLQPALPSDSYGFLMGPLFGFYVRLKCILQRLFGADIGNFGETHICFAVLDELNKMIESGYLQTVVDKVYHPEDIERALHHIQSDESIGSTIISFRMNCSHVLGVLLTHLFCKGHSSHFITALTDYLLNREQPINTSFENLISQ